MRFENMKLQRGKNININKFRKKDRTKYQIPFFRETMASSSNTSVILGSNGEQLYEVEAIRSHKGTAKKRLYQIKWKGYPESDNTWEPI